MLALPSVPAVAALDVPRPLVWLVLVLFKYPLSLLYFYGPPLLGGWWGASASDICARLTTVEASWWEHNPDKCLEIVDQNFECFYTTATVLLYFLLLVLLLLKIVRSVLY